MSSTHEQAAPGASGNQPGQQAYVPRPAHARDDRPAARPTGAQFGFTMMAAILMVLSGMLSFLEGLAAVVRGGFFVTLPRYAYDISVHGWGWFHLILGIVVFLAGVALFTDQMWARLVGTTLALVSAVVNFIYIPYQPVWSIIVIAIDVFVIWALMSPREPARN